MSALVAVGVSARAGRTLAVDGVSVSVAAGECVVIIGPNGAGKTTLLRAVTGLIPHTGHVTINDNDIALLGSSERARLVGYAPQVPTIVAEMPVRDFVMLGRAPYWGRWGQSGQNDAEAVAEALHDLDLVDLADRQMASLSGGERQRAVLAQALAQDTPVLVLDEPTTSLDIGHQQQLLELVDTLRTSRRLAVLMSLHDLGLAGQYADRLLLLDGGKPCASGTPAEVLTPAIVRRHYGVDVRVETFDGRTMVHPLRPR